MSQLRWSVHWELDFSSHKLKPARASVHDVQFGSATLLKTSVHEVRGLFEELNIWFPNYEPYQFSVQVIYFKFGSEVMYVICKNDNNYCHNK